MGDNIGMSVRVIDQIEIFCFQLPELLGIGCRNDIQKEKKKIAALKMRFNDIL